MADVSTNLDNVGAAAPTATFKGTSLNLFCENILKTNSTNFRYCPRKPAQRRYDGTPLTGTRVWCEQYGLNEDPELRRRVLDTLKSFPGAGIFIDEACIVQGKQFHLSRDSRRPSRNERPLAERITRARSRSPSRDRTTRRRERSRTPLATYRRSHSRDTMDSMNAFRSRTRMNYTSGSNAVVFEASYARQDQRSAPIPQSAPLQSFRFPATRQLPTHPAPANNTNPRPATTPQNMSAPRRALGELTNVRVPPRGPAAQREQRQEEWSEDPYFVLGIGPNATEEE